MNSDKTMKKTNKHKNVSIEDSESEDETGTSSHHKEEVNTREIEDELSRASIQLATENMINVNKDDFILVLNTINVLSKRGVFLLEEFTIIGELYARLKTLV